MLRKVGLVVQSVNKMSQGSPHTVDAIEAGEVHLIINTPLGNQARTDGKEIRVAATRHGIPLTTTLSAATAAVNGIKAVKKHELSARSLQEHHR
jgi:carbamoyl-phosphate synthase large subunit